MVTIRFDATGLVTALDNLRTGAPRAILRALNRAIAAARTVEVKAIAGDTGLKQADIRGGKDPRPSWSPLKMTTATPGNLTASLSASMKPIPLINFRAKGPIPSRGKGSGVTFQLRGGGRGTAMHAFIAQMASGHVGVFERLEGKFMEQQKPTWHRKRQAIHELKGPSLGEIFLTHEAEALARAREIFASNFEHEMSDAWNGTPVPTDPGTNTGNE